MKREWEILRHVSCLLSDGQPLHSSDSSRILPPREPLQGFPLVGAQRKKKQRSEIEEREA